MSTTKRPIWSGLPAQLLGMVLVLGGLAWMMAPEQNEDPGNGKVKPIVPPVVITNMQSECTRNLSRILNGLQPGRLGIRSDPADLAVELNRWIAKCGTDIDSKLTQDTETQRALLSEEVFNRLQEKRFLPEDAAHVRLSLLAKEIVTQVCTSAENDTQRCMDLFQFVIRNIVLVDPESTPTSTIPSTPYEAMLWGQGSAEARAWTFAVLLRQLRIDAVIIAPKEKPSQWLLGVQIPQGSLLLFDFRIGLPIPGPDDISTSPFPTAPASLSDVRSDDAYFRKLDVSESPYPLAQEDMQEFTVELIGSPSLWAKRMAELQFMLEPLAGIEIYDGLGTNALHPEASQVQRMIQAGLQNSLWKEQAISIWNYSIQQVSSVIEARAEAESSYNLKMQIFAGPQIQQLDSRSGTVVIRAADHTLHAARIEQLRGDFSSALLHFGPVLTSYKTNSTPLNEEAAHFASFWVGVSQYETQKLSAAVNTFNRFVTTVRQSQTQLVPLEQMRQSASDWKATTSLAQGNLEAAILTRKEAISSSSSRRNVYLLHRWKNIQKTEQPAKSDD